MRYFATNIIEGVERRFLTLHHFKKAECSWRFTGGKIEYGETPFNASVRELYEEIGVLAARSKFLTCVYEPSIDGEQWLGYIFHVVDYRGVPKIRETEKCDALAWLTTDELRERGSVLEAELTEYRYGRRDGLTYEFFNPYAVGSREAEYLELLRDGGSTLTDDQLAARLCLTDSAFTEMRRKLIKRLRLSRRADLVKWWEKNRFQVEEKIR